MYEGEDTGRRKRLSQDKYDTLLMDNRVMLACISETAKELENLDYFDPVEGLLGLVMTAGNAVDRVILEMERRKEEICTPELHIA